VRRRSTVRLPTAVVVIVVGALVAAMLGRPEAALFTAPWVAVVVLGLAGMSRQPARARVDLVADRIVVGDDVDLRATIEVETPGWVELRPRPEATIWGDERPANERPSVAVADAVTGQGPRRLTYSLPSPIWGTHDVGRLEVTVHEPYGLFERSGLVDEPRRLRVHPRPVDLHRLLAPWLVRRQTGVHESTAVDRGVEFADIRPFESGDSLRDINWRASARSPRLLVSQRHPERSTDVILLLDSFVESGHDVQTVVGLAIEAAVALAESHLSLTDRVGLVELGGVVRWVAPGTGRLQLQRLTDALLGTRLYANATDRDLAVIPPRSLPPRSFVVALSPLLDERFVAALYDLRGGGHDVAVIECRYDPPDPSPDSASPDIAAAAVRLFEAERAVVRDSLAERGIAVGRWRRDEHLDAVLAEITAFRRRVRGSVR